MASPLSVHDLGSETQEYALASSSIDLQPRNEYNARDQTYVKRASPDPLERRSDPYKRQLNSTGSYSSNVISLHSTTQSPHKRASSTNPFEVLYLNRATPSPHRESHNDEVNAATAKADVIDSTEVNSTYLRIERNIIESKSPRTMSGSGGTQHHLPSMFTRHHLKRRMISTQTQTDPISPSGQSFNYEGMEGPIVTIIDQDGIKRTGSLISRSATQKSHNKIKSRNKIAKREDFLWESSNSQLSSLSPKEEKQEDEEPLLKPGKKLRYSFPVKRQTSLKWRGYRRPKPKHSNAIYKSDEDFDNFLAGSNIGHHLNDLLPLALRFYKYSRLQNVHPHLSADYNKTPMYLFSSSTSAISPENAIATTNLLTKNQDLGNFGTKPQDQTYVKKGRAPEEQPLLEPTVTPNAVARGPPIPSTLKTRRNYLWFTPFASSLERKSKPSPADTATSKQLQKTLNKQLRGNGVKAILGPEALVNHDYFQLKPINPEGKLHMSDVAYGKYKTAVFRSGTSNVPPKFELMFPNDGSVVPILTQKEIDQANQRLLLEVLFRRTVKAKIEYRIRRALELGHNNSQEQSYSGTSSSSSCYSTSVRSGVSGTGTEQQAETSSRNRSAANVNPRPFNQKNLPNSKERGTSYGNVSQAAPKTPLAPLLGNHLKFSNFEVVSNSPSPGAFHTSGGTGPSEFPSPQMSYYSRRLETVSDNPSPAATPKLEQQPRWKSRRNFQPVGSTSVIIEQESPDKDKPSEQAQKGLEIASLTSIYNTDGTQILSFHQEEVGTSIANQFPLQSPLEELFSLNSVPRNNVTEDGAKFDDLTEFTYSYKRASQVSA